MKIPNLFTFLVIILCCFSCDEAIAQDEFTSQEDELHYIIISVPDTKKYVVTNVKRKLSDYHQKFHQRDSLRNTDIFLNPEIGSKIIVIRRFANKTEAMDYIHGVKVNGEAFEYFGVEPSDIYAITQANFRKVIGQKSLEDYWKYYNKTYLH